MAATVETINDTASSQFCGANGRPSSFSLGVKREKRGFDLWIMNDDGENWHLSSNYPQASFV